jgi:D-3-phosphoglycerate dehydrogenase / 2-oxoglutarate reductase
MTAGEGPLTVAYAGQPVGLTAVRETLGQAAHVVDVPETRDAVGEALRDADVYFATLKVRLDAEMIASAPRLRLVVSPTTGSDHVDLAALERRSIPFFSLKSDREFLNNITPTAELAFLHVLAAARRFREAVGQPLAGEWDSQRVAGATLYGRTLGIIGVGRLGTWMGRYGRAFGMRVIGVDPFTATWPDDVERVSLDDVMAQSDFVTIHVHLSEATRRLVGARELALMKPGTVLVNTSRGAIVDEAAVLAALESGQLAGYGCDVLEGETERPIADHAIVRYARDHSNVIITPHMGGVSPDALRRTAAFTAEKILAHFGLNA